MVAMDDWDGRRAATTLVRRAAPFASLPRSGLRRGARHARRALPERRVRRAAAAAGVGPRRRHPHRHGPARSGSRSPAAAPSPTAGCSASSSSARRRSRVGELDEEMVYESRVGDVFTLGSTSLADRGHHPRPGARLARAGPAGPAAVLEGRQRSAARSSWAVRSGRSSASSAGCAEPAARERLQRRRPRRLGRRQPARLPRTSSARRPATCPTTARSSSSGSATSSATGGSSSTRRSARRCTRRGRWRSRRGCASGTASTSRRCTPTTASSCGCPTPTSMGGLGDDCAAAPTVALRPQPDEVERIVTAEVGGSALFASRFRECAARALLLPRRDPGRRTPLWQQRQRSAQLLSVASEYGSFPIVLETMRECLQDVFDVPGLVGLMRDVEAAPGALRRGRDRSSRRRSPGRCCSATSRSSCTRATRRWPSAAPRRCRSTRRCSPSCSAQAELRELLDPRRCWPLERDLQRLSDERQRARRSRASPTCCACSAR